MNADNGNELLPIVDSEGNQVGTATRRECHNGKSFLLHPVVHLHVFDRKGRLYLQHRPDWKDIQPGRWDTAVGGHVDTGESIKEALRREAFEELGFKDFEAQFLTRYEFRSSRERELVNAYRAIVDIAPQPSDELDGGRFFTTQEIAERLGTGFFTPNFEQEYRRLFM